jgi:imidazolonepropionase-like amidohydrolase
MSGTAIQNQSALLVEDVNVWLGTGAKFDSVDVLAIDGEITAIGAVPPEKIPRGVVRISGSGGTLIPGLCDLHVHLTTNSDYEHPVDNATYRALTTPQEKLLHGLRNGVRALTSGFTTLRVMGNRDAGEVELRNFVDSGWLPGPRLVVAPWIVSMTGGRGDLLIPPSLPRAPFDTADGAAECRKAVRLQKRAGADFIKVSASGGWMSKGDLAESPNYSQHELNEIVDEAHDLGMRVAAHAHSTEGIRRALLAGVDTVEHGSLLDREAVEMMASQGTFLVPTLSVGAWLMERGDATGAHREGLQKVLKATELHRRSAQMAYEAGVKIAVGTDSTGTLCPFGEHAREMELLVDIGMSPEEALTAATRIAAEALGREGEIGTLEVGKQADMVLVNGDPTRDVSLLRTKGGIRGVFKGGIEINELWPRLYQALSGDWERARQDEPQESNRSGSSAPTSTTPPEGLA